MTKKSADPPVVQEVRASRGPVLGGGEHAFVRFVPVGRVHATAIFTAPLTAAKARGRWCDI